MRLFVIKLNIKTSLLADYANFVDTTTKQNTYFEKIMFSFVIIIISSFLFYLLFIYQTNNSFSLQQIHKTGNLDSNLISRQYKLNLMAKFMQIKFENSKLTQSEITIQLGYSSSTIKRFRNGINMLSPYRIQRNTNNKRSKKCKYAFTLYQRTKYQQTIKKMNYSNQINVSDTKIDNN